MNVFTDGKKVERMRVLRDLLSEIGLRGWKRALKVRNCGRSALVRPALNLVK
jgi:hypothetical protein